MKQIDIFTRKLLCLVVVSYALHSIKCHPIKETNGKLKKDEKRYPNGTIIGKYSYTDNQGNPIQVKYYADKASYGVELKSIKVMSDSSESPLIETLKQTAVDNLLQSTDSTLGAGSEFYNPTNIKYKTSDPFGILNKDNVKNSQSKLDLKTSPDYEIYFQNELKAPKKCGKDKVRVYLDKEKRKIREASNSVDDAVKFCSRY